MHYTPRANCALLAVLSGFIADTNSRKKSAIWEHFVVGEGTNFALCRICKQSVLRGGYNAKDVQHYTNVVQHLKAKHSEQYVEFEKALESREEDKGKARQFYSRYHCLRPVSKFRYGI